MVSHLVMRVTLKMVHRCASIILTTVHSFPTAQLTEQDLKTFLDRVNESYQNVTGSGGSVLDLFRPQPAHNRSFLQRMRDRMSEQASAFHAALYRRKDRMVNGFTSVLDRVADRLQLQKEKSGNESTRQTWGYAREMILVVKNFFQRLLLSQRPKLVADFEHNEESDISETEVKSEKSEPEEKPTEEPGNVKEVEETTASKFFLTDLEKITDLKKRIEELQREATGGENQL